MRYLPRPFVLALALLTACVASAPAPDPVLRDDLVALFPTVEIRAETPRIDFGTRAARAHLETGWSWNEFAGGRAFAWGLGEVSELDFFLAEARDLDMVLRGAPFAFPGAPPQKVGIEINGHRVDDFTLQRGMNELDVHLPATALRAGTNRMRLRYAWSRSPAATSGERDQRPLAVRWDLLRLIGVAESGAARAEGDRLFVPSGSEIVYHLAPTRVAVLRVDALDIRGSGRFDVLWQVDGEASRRLTVAHSGAWEAALPATGERPFRLTLRAVGRAGDDRGIVLRGPRILTEPATLPVISHAAKPPPRRPNALLYLVDTLRADRLGCYGQPRPLTPAIDALAAQGIVFERAVAQTSWTKPAVASILTGLGPLRHGVNAPRDALPTAASTLAEILLAAGYRTAAYVNNAHITEGSGFAQGFERFAQVQDLADRLGLHGLAWLDETGASGKPFFLYLHAIDPHAPYVPEAPFRERFAPEVDDPDVGTFEHIHALSEKKVAISDEVIAQLLALYDAEVAQADAAFGALLDGLRQRGLLDETVIVFVSDHGDAFHEHGVFGHAWDLFQQVLEVPLVLFLPGGPSGLRVSDPVQHIDIFPTLLEALGLTHPGDQPGRSLLSPRDLAGPASPIISYMDYRKRRGLSVLAGDWKLVEPLSQQFPAPRALYRPWHDPAEKIDLADEYPVLAGYLAASGRGELTRLGKEVVNEPARVDAQTRRALEALGYLQSRD